MLAEAVLGGQPFLDAAGAAAADPGAITAGLADGSILALRQRPHMPPAKVCQFDKIGGRCLCIRPEPVSRYGAGGVMAAVRILAVIYVVQAGIGIVLGFAYAVWLMY